MADPHAPGTGALADMLKHLAPYAPGLAGAVFSMAFGERLTIRGKALSAALGICSALWLAPLLCDVVSLWWPGDAPPRSLETFVGFVCGLFGMIALSALAQAIAKYLKDPLALVRVKIGPVDFGRGAGETAE